MAPYNPNIHHRRSIRLKGHDYSQAGLYFITICCQGRACLFGDVVRGEMILNDAGKMADECWLNIPKHFPNTILHAYIIMPNHIHGIIELTNDTNVGAENFSSENVININSLDNEIGAENFPPDNKININSFDNVMKNVIGAENFPPLRSPSKTIGSIVRGFKIGVTKWMRNNTDINDVWQRNYYEHIIRNEQSYKTISQYIINNPTKWTDDKFYSK